VIIEYIIELHKRHYYHITLFLNNSETKHSKTL